MMTAQALALDSGEEVAAAAEKRSFRLDEAEFEAFYERTAGPLRGYLLRACGDVTLAADLAQEAYYRLLRSDFEAEDERHRKNYLFRIATNLLKDHHRRQRPQVEVLPETAQMEALTPRRHPRETATRPGLRPAS